MEPVEVSNNAPPFFRSPRSQHQGCPVDPNHHPSKAGALTNLKTLWKIKLLSVHGGLVCTVALFVFQLLMRVELDGFDQDYSASAMSTV